MNREELFDFAEREMQKTIDGKRNNLINAAKGIAAKTYLEAFNAGYKLAAEIATADADKLVEAFNLQDWPGLSVFLTNTTGTTVEPAWTAYKTKQLQKPNEEPSVYGLRVGDEFISHNCIGVITRIDQNDVRILWDDGSTGIRSHQYIETVRPTDRHYNELSDILAAMQRGPDNA